MWVLRMKLFRSLTVSTVSSAVSTTSSRNDVGGYVDQAPVKFHHTAHFQEQRELYRSCGTSFSDI